MFRKLLRVKLVGESLLVWNPGWKHKKRKTGEEVENSTDDKAKPPGADPIWVGSVNVQRS